MLRDNEGPVGQNGKIFLQLFENSRHLPETQKRPQKTASLHKILTGDRVCTLGSSTQVKGDKPLYEQPTRTKKNPESLQSIILYVFYAKSL